MEEIKENIEIQEGKKEDEAWWDSTRLWNTGADIMWAFGLRGNGKTTQLLRKGLELYFKYGYQFVYMRRQDTDFKQSTGIDMLFDYFVVSGELEKMSHGKYNTIKYYNRAFYLGHIDEEGKLTKEKEPVCRCAAVSMSHHFRGSSWPNYHFIAFDEFMPEENEEILINEFSRFTNLVHTIRRNKKPFWIMGVGNTINIHNIYFRSFGLTNVKNQEQGSINVYTNKETNMKIAVEYCAKRVDEDTKKFFSVFNTESLKMILDGGWQAPYAPPKPIDFDEDDIEFMYFVKFDDECLQCEIVCKDDLTFTYVHKKTSDIFDEDEDLVFSQDYDVRDNWRRNILKPYDDVGRLIASYFIKDKVFYQDNAIGQTMKTYIKWCDKV